MGEAKRKVEADCGGIPRPRDPNCPACGSRRVHEIQAGQLVPFGVDCDWHGCLKCKAVWEPFPAVYVRDPVCAEPCANCAFRPGSPEQRDPERWRELMESLKMPPSDCDLNVGGWFYCHKGVPIDLTKGPGNFAFPKKPLMLNGEPVTDADGPVMTYDLAKMRTCSGFLRMVWSRRGRR